MLIMATVSILFFMIVILMMVIASFLSKKTFSDREKNSPFECGFDPLNNARIPFSLRFFLVTMIFLIFDVEIALLLPFVFYPTLMSTAQWTITLFFFIAILLTGLYYEWNQGALDWSE
uniref:NADH-ubiquinone oxidoreductase chain 3 n=1 Tax=Lepidurus apus lubbocki TaxID=217954 RepID=A0A5B7XUH3_9CRUS|nr:NADH dehydrogenase subunit 3 [Lepidurus apus lubbocki]QCZ36055.1 NADH dehydrogenase subunit 3 [Lepidurus apus lubbocki]